ncbi:PaaI family thioesterase [Allohahella sp. A8]|uniref:PaaI family thioesterase n=1 Tax=Allohahella sp. A8 TaxID=3141461 RepID=UPI003A801E3E
MSDLFEFGRTILESQPFSVLLGTQLELFEPGTAVLTLVIREELKQQHGFVHGGVVSYLADNALTFAGGSVLGDSVTSEYKINYLRPAIGKRLVAKATVVSSGRSQAVCQCTVIAVGDEGERTVAVAQGTINKVEANAGR